MSDGSVKGFSQLLKNSVSRCFNPQFLSTSQSLPVTLTVPLEIADKWVADVDFSSLLGSPITISAHEQLSVDVASFASGVSMTVGNLTDASLVGKPHSVWQKIPKELCVGQFVTFSCDVISSLPYVYIGAFYKTVGGSALFDFGGSGGRALHPGDGQKHRLWFSCYAAENANFEELVIYVSCDRFSPFASTGSTLRLFDAGNCSLALGINDGLSYLPTRDKHSDEVLNDSGVVGRTVKDALDTLNVAPVIPVTFRNYISGFDIKTGSSSLSSYAGYCYDSTNTKLISYSGVSPFVKTVLVISPTLGLDPWVEGTGNGGCATGMSPFISMADNGLFTGTPVIGYPTVIHVADTTGVKVGDIFTGSFGGNPAVITTFGNVWSLRVVSKTVNSVTFDKNASGNASTEFVQYSRALSVFALGKSTDPTAFDIAIDDTADGSHVLTGVWNLKRRIGMIFTKRYGSGGDFTILFMRYSGNDVQFRETIKVQTGYTVPDYGYGAGHNYAHFGLPGVLNLSYVSKLNVRLGNGGGGYCTAYVVDGETAPNVRVAGTERAFRTTTDVLSVTGDCDILISDVSTGSAFQVYVTGVGISGSPTVDLYMVGLTDYRGQGRFIY